MGEYLAAYAVKKGYYVNQTKLHKLRYIFYGVAVGGSRFYLPM